MPMEDSFQFIIESPQHSQGHKKRPRLVTSCDNCRLKKIKCLQPSPEAKCEACKSAKIPCRFRDRERYFAERSRAIAGPNANAGYSSESRPETNAGLDAFSVASSSSSPSLSSPRSSSHSPKASGLVAADTDPNGRYQSYPSDSRRSTESPHRHSNSASISSYPSSRADSSLTYGYMVSGSPQILPQPLSRGSQDSRSFQLFDPENPQRPHPSLMQHFIPLFFDHMGAEFNFIAFEEIMTEFWDQSLPSLMANCIAAMASRYSNMPELSVRGLHNVSEAYTDVAKAILPSVASTATMETLHALMLLSWAEYKSNRIPGFRVYCQMAMRMAVDLGLSADQNAVQMHLSDSERNRRRSTWASIVQLHLTVSSCR